MRSSSPETWLVPQYDVSRLARELRDSLGGPQLTSLCQYIDTGNWEAVVGMTYDPRAYSSALQCLQASVGVNLLKKAQDLPVKVDRKANTAAKWWEAERHCYKTNQRLYAFKPGYVQYSEADKAIARHLAGVRKIIKSWIGETPPREIELGFSPGSTLTDRGARATVAHKLHKAPSSTPGYENFGFRHFVGTLWHHNMVDAGMTPSIVKGGEYFTVPKTSLVDRAAEMQPSLNISVQLGYGRTLRRLLRRNTGLSISSGILVQGPGWDLTKAQEIHREVARRASVDRSFCTIDLSSASDTLARTLVEVLLPRRWFEELDAIRTCRISSVPLTRDLETSGCVLMEKFSSMGNGFTFELETIIFAAIACYVSRLNGYWGELGFDVFVFGDDIIVRDELYSQVKAMLGFCGFRTNDEKSFFGPHPFRESCGGDFFNGKSVRAAYLKGIYDRDLQDVIAVTNQIKALSERLNAITLGDLNRAWFVTLSHLPKWMLKCRGPRSFGDQVVYDPLPSSWTTRRSGSTVEIQILGKTACDWVPWSRFDPATQLACSVLGYGSGERGILPRNPRLSFSTDWAVLKCT